MLGLERLAFTSMFAPYKIEDTFDDIMQTIPFNFSSIGG
jgi:hypothetical protein